MNWQRSFPKIFHLNWLHHQSSNLKHTILRDCHFAATKMAFHWLGLLPASMSLRSTSHWILHHVKVQLTKVVAGTYRYGWFISVNRNGNWNILLTQETSKHYTSSATLKHSGNLQTEPNQTLTYAIRYKFLEIGYEWCCRSI